MGFGPGDLASLLLDAARGRGRRRWQGNGRLHVSAQAPAAGSAAEAAFAAAIRQTLGDQPGVNWARWNAATRRVVIDGPATQGESEGETTVLLERLAELERQLDGVAATPTPDHPADLEPVLRSIAEIVAELAGTGLGLALQNRPGSRQLGIDLAAALRVLETLPPLRASLDRRLGSGTAELLLRLVDSLDYALLRGLAGPLVGLLEEGLRLRARLQHRRRWQQVEAAWNARPEDHPEQVSEPGPRPRPLPDGPIERYGERATLLSLAAFGWGVATLRRVEGPAAAILAGLPRPAQLGRSAFCLEIGRRLEAMGALLLDPAALERLDRIDTVVLEPALLESIWGDGLLAAIRQAGLRAVVASAQPLAEATAARVDAVIPAGAAAIHDLQLQGRGVLLLGGGNAAALAAADLAIGLHEDGQPPPWQAHLIAPAGVEVAWLLLPACAAARRCAEQGVQASLLDAVVGLALALEGLGTLTSAGINQATNLLSLVAIGNGLRLARRLEGRAPLPAAATTAWHALAAEEALRRLASGPEGLDAEQLRRRRPDHGRPGGSSSPDLGSPPSALGSLVLAELDNPLTPVLATGAALSGIVGAPADAGLILGVLGLNALVGAGQRLQVERRLELLQDRHTADVWVRRGGVLERISEVELLEGDVVVLEAGEVVPADCRLIQACGLQVDEAVLTGESFPVDKDPAPCREAALADRRSMLYQGTTVVAGQASAVVVAVGLATEARRSLAAAQEASVSGGVEARLAGLTDSTTPVAALGGVALLLAALARGQDPRSALAEGVALTVAAVPEGLPVLANLAQGAAADRLAHHGVLVRNPRALEALGRVNVLCLDKTGTLTSGRIQLVQVWAEGQACEPAGLPDAAQAVLQLALWATPTPEADRPLAHPTDRALLEGALLAGLDHRSWEVLQTLPFEPARGYHANLGRAATSGDDAPLQLCVKGAPDVVLAACGNPRGEAAAAALALAERGMRVLAVARRELPADATLHDGLVAELRFAGLVVFSDPIRPTARAAVDELRRAGIAVKIITGDHPASAGAIARALDLPDGGAVLTGPEIDRLGDADLGQAALEASVFARVTSLQKLRLVRALQQTGRMVAMGGDGANDAPAIRLAQVGIALGERATDAARQAADLVVTDGSIETIGRAVLEGRDLWRSVRDAVGLLVGGNLGEIGFTVLTALAEGRSVLNTRQLLLANLLTDVAPALTIATRPPREGAERDLAEEGPEASLGDTLDRDILRRGLVTALTAAVSRGLAQSRGSAAADTVGLVSLIGSQLTQMAASGQGDLRTTAAALGSYAGLAGLVQTPPLAAAFGCTPLTGADLAQATAVGVLGAAVAAAHTGKDQSSRSA
ncbi:HAD-IC family P-type ATPase [Cyanobium sp. CH-040]|uniref:cation-translocating P-type ATPase n=1 Tax=Cyanobium sp. CH-040 TaxID=2823708 RepID=UPI0020CB6C74|nr:HAD-IC family P-type ATPase [Cyanobium sp. CH-040]MCP9928881.1 HAD-IC family P-type ATPase [Cyanobium sp. CH-040]